MAEHYDLAVVGAGSGGIGAALTAARYGMKVLLVEKTEMVGGNATRCGVNCWEPGVGGTGIPFEIYKRMKRIPQAVGIYSFGRHWFWPRPDEVIPYPGGEQLVDPTRRYVDSLLRHGTRAMARVDAYAFRQEHWHGVPFEPCVYAQVVEEMLAETGNVTLLKNTAFTRVMREGRRITGLGLESGRHVTANFYADSTATVLLALACGCETLLGQEPKAAFGEPDAPDVPQQHLNGVTLIYRVTPTAMPEVEPLPAGIPSDCWWQPSFPVEAVNHYPNGDLNINMLPTMAGREAFDLGFEAAYIECRRRVLAHWHYSQVSFPEFQNYRMNWIAPGLGVREGRRVVGRYVLSEHDLLAGLSDQQHDDIVAIADHAMDTHGADTGRAGTRELPEPYAVPFRCLLPKDVDNLLIACRGASFSSIAASSCRLSRTIMQLGQAAGTAASIAQEMGIDLTAVPPDRLQARLHEQHVQLEWPTPPDLSEYLRREDEG